MSWWRWQTFRPGPNNVNVTVRSKTGEQIFVVDSTKFRRMGEREIARDDDSDIRIGNWLKASVTDIPLPSCYPEAQRSIVMFAIVHETIVR